MPVSLAKERSVTLEIDKLEFAFYSAEDMKKISVCNVVNAVSFDSLGNSTRGGN
jgi:hypothetical protein